MKHIDNTDLTAKWILRTHNKHADHLSRILDQGNLGISLAVFHFFYDLRGKFTIDKFATHYNTYCNRCNSRFLCPETEVIDAFTQIWGNYLKWLVPPPIKPQ